MQNDREIISVQPTPVESAPQKLPSIIGKTVNVCVNCVQAPGRMVTKAARRRYHRHYHPRYRFGRHHLAADIAFAAGIVALIGANAWLLIARPSIFSPITMQWKDAPAVRVGDALTMTLDIAYDGNEPLDRATVSLVLPDGFVVQHIAPGSYDGATRTLTLPTPIAPGATIAAVVEGAVESPSDRELAFTATFHGTGVGGSERQQATTHASVRGVAMTFELEAPPTVPANGVVGLMLRYRSDAVIPLDGIVLYPAVSNPFALVDEDPWGLPRSISPGNEGHMVFSVRTKEAGTYPLDGLVMVANGARDAMTIGEFSLPLTVVDVPVQFGIASQGDGSALARLGETVEIGASYQGVNGAALPAGFARAFTVRVGGPFIADVRLQADSGNVFNRIYLRWPFEAVSAGEIVEQSFTVTIPSHVDFTKYGDRTVFASTLTPVLWLSWKNEIDTFPYAYIEGTPYTLDIAGELHLASFARYFTAEGDQIGRGPLPPRVGETTRYWVTWDLRAVMQDAGRTVVRATLPPGVAWTDRVSATAGERVVYDTATRIVSWTVDAIPRTIGSTYPAVSASFELSLTPDATMAGRGVTLLRESTAESAGTTTTAPAVTTELPRDSRAKGKGIVGR